ncbi:MAG: hypothetical protein JJV90_00770 [Spiroplasma sp.]|nr:hypothetical protein [Mycoplasmatales bacterium]
MIKLSIPQKKEEVLALIKENNIEVTLISEKGMVLEFAADNEEETAKEIKRVIKESSFGAILYFSINVV